MTILVFGHKHPDTDSVVSAIAAAEILKQRGFQAKAMLQGEPNEESSYVLDKFGLALPDLLKGVAGEDVALVDTTELAQLPDDIDRAEVKFVFDHHRLGGLVTTAQFEGWIMPVGCSATVLKRVADYYGLVIKPEIAGAMLHAIVSDTVLFKSPTTTEEDKMAAEELAKIAGIDVMNIAALGMDMLKVKSAIKHKTPVEIINTDIKTSDIHGHKFTIGQVELVDLHMIDEHLAGIHKEMKAMGGNVIMVVTDIMREGSLVLVHTTMDDKIAKIFGVELHNNEAWIAGMMSRKKQVVPPLMEGLAG